MTTELFTPAFHTTSGAANTGPGLPVIAPSASTPHDQPLHVRLLKSKEERNQIAHLRQFAAFGVEQDLAPELIPLESFRDNIGLVFAIDRGGKTVATMRGVPTGYDATFAEAAWKHAAVKKEIFEPTSWEVGRLIVAPDERTPEMLSQVLAATLQALVKHTTITRLHATSNMLLARLYRRFGYISEHVMQGKSGTSYAFLHGPIDNVIYRCMQPTLH